MLHLQEGFACVGNDQQLAERTDQWPLSSVMRYGRCWPKVMLPTNGGQSDQALVDSSKASGAT